MNAWLIGATALLAGLVPCGAVALRRTALEGLVALELGSVLVTLDLLLLAQGFARGVYFATALVLALMSLVGGLTLARFLERWL